MSEYMAYAYDVSRRYVTDNKSILGRDVSEKILGWIRSRDLSRLASCRSSVGFAYLEPQGARVLMQVEAFFKKNAAFTDERLAQNAAESAFERAERICRITNRRLDFYYTHRDRLDPDMRKWMSKMEAFVGRVLGEFSPFLGRLPELVRMTSGATSTRSRRQALPALKLSAGLPATAGAQKYLVPLAEFYGWPYHPVHTVVSNRVEFVPKNWKTKRTIACEPDGNMPLQLAFDTYAKSCLVTIGQDLSNQVRNQELARLASVDDNLATIDLSMASDTLAYNTVAWLLPQPWFEYVAAVRSPLCKLDKGTYLRYAKFSSMGNGTTFTLETLVFAAACAAVGSKRYSVYGDDIIIESELAIPLLRLLKFLGFAVNTDKSYVKGPFRESCGSNWFRGVDITPFYIREWNKRRDVLAHNINGLAGIATPDGSLWAFLRQLVEEHKPRIVPFNGDSMSGVWVSVTHAYDRGLFRKDGDLQVPKYKAYKARTGERQIRTSKSYFLWHLTTNLKPFGPKGVRGHGPIRRGRTLLLRGNLHVEEAVESSRNTLSNPGYRSKWCVWIPPVVATPDLLFHWSDYLLR